MDSQHLGQHINRRMGISDQSARIADEFDMHPDGDGQSPTEQRPVMDGESDAGEITSLSRGTSSTNLEMGDRVLSHDGGSAYR